MPRAHITTLKDTDNGLVTVVHAYNGQGLGALYKEVRDEALIAEYGEYPLTQSFPTATSLADLQTQAQELVSAPPQQLSATVYPEGNPDYQVGDTVPVVSSVDNFYTEAEIKSLKRIVSAGETSYQLDLGSTLPGIIDQIFGDPEADKERKLGLPAPILRAESASPGIKTWAQFSLNSRAAYVNLYAAQDPNFVPSQATLRVSEVRTSPQTLVNVIAGANYSVVAIAYDQFGAASPESNRVRVQAGYVGKEVLDPTIEETLDNATATSAEVAARKDVWELANLLAEGVRVEGTVTAASGTSVTADVDFGAAGVEAGYYLHTLTGDAQTLLITAVTGATLTLDSAPSPALAVGDAIEAQSLQNVSSRPQKSIVATLGKAPDDPSQFTSIYQNSQTIQFVAGKFDHIELLSEDGKQLLSEDGKILTAEEAVGAEELGINLTYALLEIQRNEIEAIVSGLGGDSFGRLVILEDEIDQRVVSGTVIASINLEAQGSSSTVRIRGDAIQLNGDVAITGDVEITNSQQTNYGLDVRDALDNLLVRVGPRPATGFDWAGPFGVYTEAGGGFYAKGIARIIKAGPFDERATYIYGPNSWPAGAENGASFSIPLFDNFTVPAGKQAMLEMTHRFYDGSPVSNLKKCALRLVTPEMRWYEGTNYNEGPVITGPATVDFLSLVVTVSRINTGGQFGNSGSDIWEDIRGTYKLIEVDV